MLKVFISYSTQDRTMATRLYTDLGAAGADVFQFGQTETVGTPSWEQVLAWINGSDVFIVLLSKSALSSRPVNEEIEQANYSRINRKRPDKVIPAIIEHGVQPPLQIERFTTILLIPYEQGVKRLIRQLGLTMSSGSSKAAKPLELPDPVSLFNKYLRANPAPTPAKQWAVKAEKIMANYNALKPPEIGDDVRADHIDSILADLSGSKTKPKRLAKLDNIFLGLTPDQSDSGKQPSLVDKLISYDSRPWTLNAPVLKEVFLGIEWDLVLGASAYTVEESASSTFLLAKEVYSGPEKSYFPPLSWGSMFYRVKAVGDVFAADSAWSNVVEHPKTFFKPVLSPLAAPKLRVEGNSLKWTEAPGASRYLLQSSATFSFEEAETVYEGTETAYYSFILTIPVSLTYYRVKARHGLSEFFDSPWSEVVHIAPWDRNSLYVPNVK